MTVPCSMPVGTTRKPAAATRRHLVRQRRGRDIDLPDRLADQRVAHRAADHARLLAVAVERVQELRQQRLAQPGGVRDPGARVT